MKSIVGKLCLLAFIIVLFGCNPSPKEEIKLTAEDQLYYSSYIQSYPSGIKSKKASFNIRLAQIPQGLNIAEPVSSKLLRIQPKVEGTLSWLDNKSLSFVPQNALKSDQLYRFTLDLKALYPDVDPTHTDFQFDIRTRKMSLYRYEPRLFPYDDKDPTRQHIEGTVRVNEEVDIEELEACLTAIQNNKDLEVEWTRINAMEFAYSIPDVIRKETPGMVNISISGKPIGADMESTVEVNIPPLNVFKVIDFKLVQNDENRLDIEFSDYLDKDQNIKGLVRLANGANIRTAINRNVISVYPTNRQTGLVDVIVDKGIRNSAGSKLNKEVTYGLNFKKLTPQLSALSSGAIMPSSNEGLIFPFKAVSLYAVQVSVVQVFEDNIGQFLQVNDLNSSEQIKRVGRLVHKSNVVLGDREDQSLQTWKDYAIDLSTLMSTDPGALYRIRISFGKEHAIRDCGDDEVKALAKIVLDTDSEYKAYDEFQGYYDSNEYYEQYWLKDNIDPCTDEYYQLGNPNSKPIFQNIIASDIGIVAKKSKNDQLFVALTDLKTTKSLAGKKVSLFNLQNQIIQTATTDNNGFVDFNLEGQPFYLIAEDGKQKGYLKLDDGSSLSLSTYDVSGGTTQKGLKAFLYQERGVSRPGDSLFITMIVDDRDNPLPGDHPVVFELYDPRGQRVERRVQRNGLNNFYAYRTSTDPNSPTGNWNVKAMVGGVTFSKRLKIETVKPNRLKIDLDFAGDLLTADNTTAGTMEVKWLHGAVARNLKADVEMTVNPSKTVFDGWNDYQFDDISKDFESDVQKIFDGRLDEAGTAQVTPKITVKSEAPGMLQASFKIRAFEEGGNFSVDRFEKKYSPFDSYVGVKLPKGPGWNNAIYSDKSSDFEIVTVGEDGRPVQRDELKVEIFNLSWNWWWERSSRNNIRNYVSNRSQNLLQSTVVSTNNSGKGIFSFNLNQERYGRTLIRITDPISGHSTSKVFYTTYSRWWDDGGSDDIPGAAEMLTFKSDKESYEVGENIHIELPKNDIGRALVSVENGTEILQKFWVDLAATDGKLSLQADTDMAPNAYLNITYIQPHGQVANDSPIRLYGVQRISVIDPETKLEPVLIAPNEIRPETDYELTVKEKNGQPMTYTIAVVDDGLLDLTRFKTPQPWDLFYAREALGVKTWDLFSDVMGAYGGTLTKLLAIGGDEFAEKSESQKANRFKPVVKYIGPFQLESGKSASHKLSMPNYIGSVRAMVVAGNPTRGAYGQSDATIPVKKPLMVVTTLPRVLGPSEELEMPVTVFAMDSKIKNVDVKISSNNLLDFNQTAKTIRFNEIGEQVIRFPLKVSEGIGIAKVNVSVTSGGETASEEIEMDVRLPNPAVTTVEEALIAANNSKRMDYSYFGVKGTNEGILELSTIPPLNLEQRLGYLIRYPHGCIEQTTSAAFPQMFLADVAELTSAQKDRTQDNINRAITRLKRFQTSIGGFSYWPGQGDVSKWGTSYAGHFLLEAKQKGYKIPYGMIDQWSAYQSTAARNWSDNPPEYWSNRSHRLDQAYRLYTLASAQKPELGAMNRLRGIDNLESIVKWRLAGAYAKAGKPEIAQALIASADLNTKSYKELAYTYGSGLRDDAMILETLTLLNDRLRGSKMIKTMSSKLGSRSWYSTQATAYALMAISKFIDSKDSAPLNLQVQFGGDQSIDIEMTKPIQLIKIPPSLDGADLSIKNQGSKEIYARVILTGIPLAGTEKATSSNINIKTTYTDLSGKVIDPNKVLQGSDINIETTISHNGQLPKTFKEMALTHILPAGWEIRNTRMDDTDSVGGDQYFDYQDVRDDRVQTYFSLRTEQSKTFRTQVNASYSGKYYLPAVQCEAMYDNTISASTTGQWINVVSQ